MQAAGTLGIAGVRCGAQEFDDLLDGGSTLAIELHDGLVGRHVQDARGQPRHAPQGGFPDGLELKGIERVAVQFQFWHAAPWAASARGYEEVFTWAMSRMRGW